MEPNQYLLPLPKEIVIGKGIFQLDGDTSIILDIRCSKIDFETAKLLQSQIKENCTVKPKIKKVFSFTKQKNCIRLCPSECEAMENPESYRLKISEDSIDICAPTDKGIFYGVTTFIQLVRVEKNSIPCMEIRDEPDFSNRGYLLDVTRGRVPTIDYLKSLIDRLALYKINQLQLYVESSVTLDGLEEIWSQTDPLLPQEIMEIDDYCEQRCIELVPCIATFGHLYDLLRSKSFSKLNEMDSSLGEPFTWYHRMRYHIINVTDDKSFQLITSILDQYLPLFRSQKINICCDETFDFGKGKSKDMASRMGHGEMYLSYVNKLASYLQEKGHDVQIWSDIVQHHPDCIASLNKDITCLNWYYYYNMPEERIKLFRDQQLKQYVCPSVSGFSRLVNAYDMSFTNIKELAQLGKQGGADGLLNTDWGDSGHSNMPALAIPAMIYGGCLSWNTSDNRNFSLMDEVISLVEYADETKTIVGLLRELSKQDHIIFNDIIFFRDYKIFNLPYPVSDNSLYEIAKKEMETVSEEQLHNAVKCSKEIARKFMCFSNLMKDDAVEFYLSARGVALVHSMVLIIKQKEYHQEVQLLEQPDALAIQFERWLMEYCTAWRTTSREGELYRIKEFVAHICKILREYAEI